MVRMRNRHQLMALVLNSTASIRIYGSENWADWPQYRRYYQHFVHHSDELKRIYQTTKLNLHEGVGPHFRVFDAMSAGGLMFVKRTPDDRAEGGMLEIFEPFVHYVPFLENDFVELAERYLNDDAARCRIIDEAAKQIQAKHTWSHRAAKIIEDYRRVR